MWLWVEVVVDKLRDFRDDRPLNRLNTLSESDSHTWNIDHVKSKIMDANELLQVKVLWRKILLLWATIGNAALLALLIVGSLWEFTWFSNYETLLIIMTVISLALSPVVIYRQYRIIRRILVTIRKLNIVYRRVKNERGVSSSPNGDESDRVLAEQKRYRDELPEVISQYRDEANRYRRVHNRLQSVIIIGSVLTSAITTASVSFEEVRWVAVGISAIVGLAAGFTGYFKYRDRSFNLQQTADAIEREVESVELRVGKYSKMAARDAYMVFATVVESLRDEQNKRQQQLDQPVEVKRDEQ
jgi:hypothetical protein